MESKDVESEGTTAATAIRREEEAGTLATQEAEQWNAVKLHAQVSQRAALPYYKNF